jgi:glycosyltransferase involved in cell wall biosynthesis
MTNPAKKNILIYIDWFYPGFRSGGPARSVWNMVQKLKAEYNFYVFTRNIDYVEETAYLSIPANTWMDLEEGLKVWYQDHTKLSKAAVTKPMKSIAWDICYINGLYSYFFSILPTLHSKKYSDKKIIVCPRGMLSSGSIAVKGIKKKNFVRLARNFGLYKHVHFHATKEQEKEDIQEWIGAEVITVVPNFPSEPVKEDTLSFPLKEKGSLNLIWLGRISPEKNLLFALKVLRNMRAGKITFMIYGVIYDKEYWKECQAIIQKLPSRITVEYKGVLEPEEIPYTLTNFHFFFLPTTGENYGHAILESLLAGTPVIISNTTPWQGLHEDGLGWDLPLYRPKEFLKVMREVVQMDMSAYVQLRKRVMRYREKILDIRPQLAGYKKLFG